MKKRISKQLYALLPFLILSTQVQGEESQSKAELYKNRPPRDQIWLFEANLFHHQLVLPDQTKFSGLAGGFGFGYGKTHAESWVIGSGHLIAGPFDAARDQQFDAEFSGGKFEIEYGQTMPTFSFRGDGQLMFAVSAGYLAYTGRNVGENKRNTGNIADGSNYYLEQDFKTSFNAFVLTPSLGLYWTKPTRPSGVEEELLATRIESSFMKLGLALPVYSKSRVEVTKRDESESLSQAISTKTQSGRLKGFSLIITTGIWLGV